MTSSELRAALAPLVKAFKPIIELADKADELVAHETRLKGLGKERIDTEQAVQGLKGQLSDAQKALDAKRHELAEADAKVRAATRTATEQHETILAETTAHQKALASAQAAQDKKLAAERKDHETAIATAKAQLAGVNAELTAAQNRLASFHDQMRSLSARQ